MNRCLRDLKLAFMFVVGTHVFRLYIAQITYCILNFFIIIPYVYFFLSRSIFEKYEMSIERSVMGIPEIVSPVILNTFDIVREQPLHMHKNACCVVKDSIQKDFGNSFNG